MTIVADERRERLIAAGASEGEALEVVTYAENLFAMPEVLPRFPLTDEAFASAWASYASDVAQSRSLDALRLRLVQLAFRVETGMSSDSTYQAATKKGIFPKTPIAGGANFSRPDAIDVSVYPSYAGRIGVLAAVTRADFETLIRAFTGKNEPIPVPPSMGASMVSGYNNWDRIHTHHREFLAAGGAEEEWGFEFQRIKEERDLYQDRFIILSTGPYSGVEAKNLGMSPDEWVEHSHTIRLEHECAHYFTRRALGSMRNNLLDEIMADYAGIRSAFGRFRAECLLWFLGLERYPEYRDGGRLQNYTTMNGLSPGAARVLRRLVWEASWNLEKFDSSLGEDYSLPQALCTIASMTLDELAETAAPARLAATYLRFSIAELRARTQVSQA